MHDMDKDLQHGSQKPCAACREGFAGLPEEEEDSPGSSASSKPAGVEAASKDAAGAAGANSGNAERSTDQHAGSSQVLARPIASTPSANGGEVESNVESPAAKPPEQDGPNRQ